MRLHYLQHVPFEGLANIAAWAADRGHEISGTHLYQDDVFPDIDAFDMLVVLGGPLNVDQHDAYPWLPGEKQFIGRTIERDKAVLGACLGAQLIARALGAEVKPNANTEIGWFPVSLTEEGRASRFFLGVPDDWVTCHWHGDTFDIPADAVRLAESRACRNQGFQYGDRVLALQFHMEYSEDSVAKMVEHCAQELVDGPFIQSPNEILAGVEHIAKNRARLIQALDALADSTRA